MRPLKYIIILIICITCLSWKLKKDRFNVTGKVQVLVEKVRKHMAGEFLSVKVFDENGNLISNSEFQDIYDTSNEYFEEKSTRPLKVTLDTSNLKLQFKELFEYSKTNNITEIKEFSENRLWSIRTFKYNKLDSLIEDKKIYFNTDTLHGDSTFYKYLTINDTIHRITIKNKNDTLLMEKLVYDSLNRLKSNIQYKHDYFDSCIKNLYYTDYGKITYIEQVCVDDFEDEPNFERRTFLYNEKRLLTRFESTKDKGYGLERKEYHLKYNSEGKLISEIDAVFDDNEFEYQTNFTFDEFENAIKIVSLDWFRYQGNFKSSQSTSIISYNYDKNGNWTKRLIYDGNRKDTTERIILYFEQ